MDSSPSKTLSKLLEEIIQWSMESEFFIRISWKVSHLSTILHYVFTLGAVDDDFCLLMNTKLCLNEVWHRRFDPRIYKKIAQMVASFTQQDLLELFKVPKLRQPSENKKALKKNELVAVFISFLVQLLDRSDNDNSTTLRKELRYLITILGDTPFEGTELEEIHNHLAEFEGVANEAGILVHSLIFPTDKVFKTTDEAIGGLLEHIDLLKAHIIRFSHLLPSIITPKASAGESLFIIDSLLYDLEDLMNREDDRIIDVKDQIKALHRGLMLSQSLLKDTKVALYSEVKELKEAMMQIRGVAYEAEYLINFFLVGDAPLWYLTIRLPNFIRKIELIGTGLQETKNNYHVGALKVAKDFSAQSSLQGKRNSDQVNDIIIGLEDETTSILNLLIGGSGTLQIISIYGMPGLGKTTLAKKLYNHPSVDYYFDKCSWCVISQTYQRKNLLIDILISLGSELDKVTILNMEEESLAEHIYRSLKGRRYLIVMDDVWNSNVWDDLRRYFPDDGNGSRILFTTRNKDVAPTNSIFYALPSLSSGQCWELLEKMVFRNKLCPLKLQSIGMKIAADCNGLPLAVVVIAGILSTTDQEESTWKNVGESLASYIFSDKNNSMMQILKLSYEHLPEHLKPCFLYFGAFPEDREIPVKKLKCLWIAEGFICKEEKKDAECVAEDYLMELIDKSLVIVAKRRTDGGVKACVVHDVLRDLCLRIAEEQNFLKLMDNNYSIQMKNQRLFDHMNLTSEVSPQFLLPLGLHLRSYFCSLPNLSLYILNMKLLRVLDLPNKSLGIDDRIGLLVHLRYLAVKFVRLASIGSLLNLEFLIVSETKVKPLPIARLIQRMMKLRYLRIHVLAGFGRDCNSSHANNLEFLSSILIDKLKDEEMLKCSPYLRKLKCKCAPFWDKQGVCRYPDLRFLTQLESLNMSGNFQMAEINFPPNIRKLTLYGLCLPWEKMSIIGGFPNLQVLKLEYEAFVGGRWDTRDGEFQQLIFLKLNGLRISQWNVASSEHFPKLQRLLLRHCFNLQQIPGEMGDIPTLQLIEVELCQQSLVKSAVEIRHDQRIMGNEELRFIIRD